MNAKVYMVTGATSGIGRAVALELAKTGESIPEFLNVRGKFLHKGKPLDPAAYALDPENQRRLWDISEQLTDAREIA